MAITLKFDRVSEKFPDNNQPVVILKKLHDQISFIKTVAEYVWVKYDEIGWVVEILTEDPQSSDYKLEVILNSSIASDETLWMNLSEYQSFINKIEKR